MSTTPINAEQSEFNELVFSYAFHQKLMQLQFLEDSEASEPPKFKRLRKLEPTDLKNLSEVEFSGLLYWLELQKGYKELAESEKSIIIKNYSVKKLSLDHFYSASKFPEKCKNREFVMNNFTFVPENRTGFELIDDDEQQIWGKRKCFSRTFDRFWSKIINPFVDIKITDAEIVFMHLMLLWSDSANSTVSQTTQIFMEERRKWAQTHLSIWYQTHGVQNFEERFQKILEFVEEIEVISGMHCEDFQLAEMYKIGDLKEFFYEKLCYAPKNVEEDFYEQFKEFEEQKESTSSKTSEGLNVFGDIDPTRLVLNSTNLGNVFAPLPDDVPYFFDGCIM